MDDLGGPNIISEVLIRGRWERVAGDVMTEVGGWSDVRKGP